MENNERTLAQQLKDHLTDLDDCLARAHGCLVDADYEGADAFATLARAEAAAVHAKLAHEEFRKREAAARCCEL